MGGNCLRFALRTVDNYKLKATCPFALIHQKGVCVFEIPHKFLCFPNVQQSFASLVFRLVHPHSEQGVGGLSVVRQEATLLPQQPVVWVHKAQSYCCFPCHEGSTSPPFALATADWFVRFSGPPSPVGGGQNASSTFCAQSGQRLFSRHVPIRQTQAQLGLRSAFILCIVTEGGTSARSPSLNTAAHGGKLGIQVLSMATPTLADMVSQMRDIVRATCSLWGSVSAGHPWHKAENCKVKHLASCGYRQPLPGPHSKLSLRFPSETRRSLADLALAHPEAPLRAVAVPNIYPLCRAVLKTSRQSQQYRLRSLYFLEFACPADLFFYPICK